MSKYSILVVDDKHSILDTVGSGLEEEGYQVTTIDNGKAAIEAVAKTHFDLIITDLVMDEPDGMEVLRNTKELSPETMVIILTGYGDMESVVSALRLGADDYLVKPCDIQEINFRVSKCLEKQRLNREFDRQREALLESEERYRGLFENSTDFVYTLDLKGNFTDVNKAAEHLTGYTREELSGMNFMDYTPADSHKDIFEVFNRIFKEGTPLQDFPLEVTVKDGTTKYFQTSVAPLRKGERIIGFHGSSRDITHKVHSEQALRQSEEKYRTILDSIEEAYFEVDITGNFTFFNDSLSKSLGYSNDELMGMNNRDYMSPESAKKIYDIFNQIYNTGNPIKKGVYEIIRKDGSHGFHELSASLMKNQAGQPIGFRGIAHDITESKKAEEALRESEEKYRTLADSSLTGVFIHQDSKYVFVNDGFAEMHGYEPEELLGRNHLDLIHPDQREIIRQRADKRLKGEEVPRRYEIKRLKKDGEAVWHEIMVSDPITYRVRPAIMGHEIDITGRKKAEEALRVSEERFRAIFEQAAVGVALVEAETGRFFRINQKYCDIVGYTQEEMTGTTFMEITHPDDLQRDLDNAEKRIRGEIRGHASEKRYVKKDGSIVWVNLNVSPMWGVGEKPNYHIAVVEDITRRKQVEEALRESEKRFRSLFDQAAEAIFVHDLSGHIKDVNRVACEIWGYDKSEFLDLCIEDLDPDALERGDKEIFWDQLEEKAPIVFEARNRRKDGSLFPVEVSLSPIQFGGQRLVLGIVRDILERKQAEKEKVILETQLQQAQKVEAIATLAGGIAHQFNNALSSITGYSGLLEMDYPQDEKITGYTEAMKQSAHRMAHLTDQLLAYARGGKYNPEILSLNSSVKDTLPLLQPTLDPLVHVETELPLDVMKIEADSTQMQMVISAIVANSNEATEGPGRIRISTRNMGLDREFIKDHPGLTPGFYICLSVEDDGKGMDEETKNRIFDPFFTTHFMGRGLGMAAVYGIIKNHDGAITVDTEPGKGTVVRIYLPAIEAKEEVKEEVVLRPTVELATGEGTILVIEDEEPLVELFRKILERLGYRVLQARTGKEAVEFAKTFDGQIDLALLDIKLPDMDGGRVYPLIMEARPDLKVIVCSGYSIDGPAQAILDAGAEGFIQKPFSIAPFAEKLKEVLEG